MSEFLLCVRRSDCPELDVPDGHGKVFTGDPALLFQRVALKPMFLLPKKEAETMPEWLQLIAYCMFRGTAGSGEPHVFTYWRGRQAAETRLHGKKSLGVGGHLSSVDCGIPSSQVEAAIAARQTRFQLEGCAGGQGWPIPLSEVTNKLPEVLMQLGLRRELVEEVGEAAANHPDRKLVGLIHDRRDAVGCVHLGLLYRFEIAPDLIVPGEELSADAWQKMGPDPAFEGWSQLVADSIS